MPITPAAKAQNLRYDKIDMLDDNFGVVVTGVLGETPKEDIPDTQRSPNFPRNTLTNGQHDAAALNSGYSLPSKSSEGKIEIGNQN